jgi:hypothetical protein
VEVVAHQHVGVQRHALLARVSRRAVQQQFVVRRAGEDRLPVVAALDDVVGVAGTVSRGRRAIAV